MVSSQGIEVNSKNIKASTDMKAPTNIKILMRLIEKIAGLNKFISRCTDQCIPFFNLLKKHKDFV